MSEEPGRIAAVELGFGGLGRDVGFCAGHEIGETGRAHVGRLRSGECGVLLGGDVTHVTGQVHDFVIAEHEVDVTAGNARLRLQRDDQVERQT